ncbi:ClbS/DfsB family four-helix bundle protein [uncultured Tateyamaria sp.]|uniref:ClbS/DfsB family four-helix bundle protein n=1 Tax=uncultured Tateyamaria sp. TaxID=455651 RepID=UPI002636320B|nr:ClbS/DfsB family four-helix bundle protein [uncultured Tateyamaria sp.]
MGHLFLGWHKYDKAGKTVFFPAEGYKQNDLKRYNTDLRKTQQQLDWITVSGWRCEPGRYRNFGNAYGMSFRYHHRTR